MEDTLDKTEQEQILKYIGIQYKQLCDWKTVLLPHVFEALVNWSTSTNCSVKKADSIRRGNDLSTFVSNYALGHHREYNNK